MTRDRRRNRYLGRLGAIAGTFLLLAPLLLTVGASIAIAADTGAKAPTATQFPNAWTDAGNAFANDGSYATASVDNAEQGYDGFGFAVPAGSVIDGITVKVEAKSTDSSGCDLQVAISWNDGANYTSPFKTADLTDSDSLFTLGGATDDWGHAWTPAETNGHFRLTIHNEDPGGNCQKQFGPETTSVDYITVAVNYTTINAGTANPALTSNVCDQADFGFAIDRSGSIDSSESTDEKNGINGFVTAYEALGDGLYTGTRFGESAGTTEQITAGFVAAGTFTTAVSGMPGTGGYTATGQGIREAIANAANDRPAVPNVLFVVTDGSPNRPSGADDVATALSGANAAINAANAARAVGWVVEAIYVGTPDDSTLPFSSAGNEAWVDAVMDGIGGGTHSTVADFTTIATTLYDLLACPDQAHLTLVKNLAGDGQASATDWTLTATGPDTLSGPGGAVGDVAAGSYTLSESGDVPNYSPGAWDCDGGSLEDDVVTLAAGERATCAITNTYSAPPTDSPPPSLGTLVIEKDAIGGNGTFHFEVALCADGCGDLDEPYERSITTTGGSGSTTLGDLEPGDYVVSEVGLPGGWTLTDSGCFSDISVGIDAPVIAQTVSDSLEINVPAGQTVTCVFENTTQRTPPPQLPPSLAVDKSYTGNTGGEVNGVQLSKTGDTLSFTLAYTIANPPVTGGVITDVLPVGLDYVAGSATGNGIFSFVDYNAGTRTLTWTAPIVLANGSVTYKTTVSATGSQTIDNVAVIDSVQTLPDEAAEVVFVQEVLAETGAPQVTLPPTDSTIGTNGSNPGGSLGLILLALVGTMAVLGVFTPTPARSRRRDKGE